MEQRAAARGGRVCGPKRPGATKNMTAKTGTVYLLHFTPHGYKHARHYLGSAASSGIPKGSSGPLSLRFP